MINPAVEVQSISKRFGRVLALDEVSFTIPRGEMFGLLGPNGAGKTTLLDILCTLSRPDTGEARICGADVVHEAWRARSHLGVVFQQSSLDNRLSVEENLLFHARIYAVPFHERRRKVEEMLIASGLIERREALVQTLSIGMRRRLEIARALMHQAEVLILDEPTVGLDAQAREQIWHFIAQLRKQRALTLIITTHYVEELASADRICIIDQGKVITLDTPAELVARHGQRHMRITPISAETRALILDRFAALVAVSDDDLILTIPNADFPRSFLAEFGNDLYTVSFDYQGLEGVFLTVTGRKLTPNNPAISKQGRI